MNSQHLNGETIAYVIEAAVKFTNVVGASYTETTCRVELEHQIISASINKDHTCIIIIMHKLNETEYVAIQTGTVKSHISKAVDVLQHSIELLLT